MRDYLQLIDTDTPGPRNDVTPLFANHEAFSALVEDLLGGFADVEFDCVAGIDALGFILGTAIAMRAGKGFVPIRKGGKLPVKADVVALVDYTGETKTLELRAGAIEPGTRVLLVDEWIETGAQAKAAVELIEGQGGRVAGIATVSMDRHPTTDWLRARYRCHTVWEASDEEAYETGHTAQHVGWATPTSTRHRQLLVVGQAHPTPGESESMSIQDLVREHRTKWAEVDQWQDPDLADCLDFMATEVAEAIDKRLRTSPRYVRNHAEPPPLPLDIGVEVFDAIMMGCIALDLLGLDLDEIARAKLERMDRKRGVA